MGEKLLQGKRVAISAASIMVLCIGCQSQLSSGLKRILLHEGEWIMSDEIRSIDMSSHSVVKIEQGALILDKIDDDTVRLVSRSLVVPKLNVCGRQDNRPESNTKSGPEAKRISTCRIPAGDGHACSKLADDPFHLFGYVGHGSSFRCVTVRFNPDQGQGGTVNDRIDVNIFTSGADVTDPPTGPGYGSGSSRPQ
jgi:hypothetical protein